MKTVIKYLSATVVGVSALFATSCLNDLDQYPTTDSTPQDIYTSVENYESVLAGVYTSLVTRVPYVSGDSRYQNFIRTLFMFQECSADLMDSVWLNGESLNDVAFQSWRADDGWVAAMYYHIFNVVARANELIRNSSDDYITRFSEQDQQTIRRYRAEARTLRALAYYHAMDLFAVVPFVTESDPVGSYIPSTADRKALFAYLETELKDVGEELPSTDFSRSNRVSRGYAWALLARMYLNAEIYTGENRYTDCIEYGRKVLDEGYSLEDNYAKLFNADNDKRTNEIIFSLAVDAVTTMTWDASTFVVCGGVLQGYEDVEAVMGVESAWDNMRVRPQLINLFEGVSIGSEGITVADDARARFCARNRTADGQGGYDYADRASNIAAHDDVSTGWWPMKWSNLRDDGSIASKTGSYGVCTDFPMMRLSEVYLMLSEAVVRGGGGATRAEALSYLNAVRSRAGAAAIYDSEMTADFILAERGRELYMECARRTDLIRFGRYTSGYAWQWKGGSYEGVDVDSKYRYLPIPEAELSANPTLKSANTAIGF